MKYSSALFANIMVRTKHLASKHSTLATPKVKSSSTTQSTPISIFTDKNVIPEKGIHSNCLAPPHGLDSLSRVITILQWDQFCNPREQPALHLVREFYTNLREHRSSIVHVQGRAIPLSARSLNDIFALPDHAIDGYETMLQAPSEATYNQVLYDVTLEGTN